MLEGPNVCQNKTGFQIKKYEMYLCENSLLLEVIECERWMSSKTKSSPQIRRPREMDKKPTAELRKILEKRPKYSWCRGHCPPGIRWSVEWAPLNVTADGPFCVSSVKKSTLIFQQNLQTSLILLRWRRWMDIPNGRMKIYDRSHKRQRADQVIRSRAWSESETAWLQDLAAQGKP